jgi:hypothetical protein
LTFRLIGFGDDFVPLSFIADGLHFVIQMYFCQNSFHFEGGLLNLAHSSIVYESFIDELQREQIGLKFRRSVVPPLLSGMLCPD